MSAPEPDADDEVTLYFYFVDNIRPAERAPGWAHRCRTLAARRRQRGMPPLRVRR